MSHQLNPHHTNNWILSVSIRSSKSYFIVMYQCHASDDTAGIKEVELFPKGSTLVFSRTSNISCCRRLQTLNHCAKLNLHIKVSATNYLSCLTYGASCDSSTIHIVMSILYFKNL